MLNAEVGLELATPLVWVVKTSLVAAPKVEGEKFELVAVVRPLALALRV
jgi:hypothetical protein